MKSKKTRQILRQGMSERPQITDLVISRNITGEEAPQSTKLK